MKRRKKLTTRIVSFMLCMAVILTSIQIPGMTVSAAGLEETAVEELGNAKALASEAFVIKNGDFSDGLTNWNPFAMVWWDNGNPGTGNATFITKSVTRAITNEGEGNNITLTETSKEEAADVDGIKVHIENAYIDIWGIALEQDVKLYPNVEYTVSFDVKSTIDRAIKTGFTPLEGEDLKSELSSLKADEKTTVTYTVKSDVEWDGKFYFQLGQHTGQDTYEPHDIYISNLKIEEAGASEKYILVKDYDFSDSSLYQTAGTVQDGYIELNGQSITYPNLEVVEGQKYKLRFMARGVGNEAAMKATVGNQTVAETAIDVATQAYEYEFEFTAEQTGTVALAINATGTVLLDNLSLTDSAADAALGLDSTYTEIRLTSVNIATERNKVTKGKEGSDLTVQVTADDAWANAAYEVYVNNKKVDASLCTRTGTQITIANGAFVTEGNQRVYIKTSGYEDSNSIVAEVLPASGNLLSNPYFENGLVGWNFSFFEGSGTAQVKEDYSVDVTVTWFQEWYAQHADGNWYPHGTMEDQIKMGQGNINIEAGETYALTFDASCNIERPMSVVLKSGGDELMKQYFVVGPEKKNYTFEYDANITLNNAELTFNFGEFGWTRVDADDPSISTREATPVVIDGVEWQTPTDANGHSVNLKNITFGVKSENASGEMVPRIVGIQDGAKYIAPVAAKVNSDNEYTYTLTKDGSAVAYEMGELIREDGSYVLRVASKEDASLYSEKSFTIAKDVDETKEYVLLKSRATGKVVTSAGLEEEGAIVQTTYTGDPSQLFSLEKSGKYYLMRSLTTNKVVECTDNNYIVQADYIRADDSQLWTIAEINQGYMYIKNKKSSKYLAVPDNSTAEKLQLQQADQPAERPADHDAYKMGQDWDIITVSEEELTEIMEGVTVDVSTKAKWKENALITPIKDELNPAGKVTAEFWPYAGATSYEIYFDGELTQTITQDMLAKATKKDEYYVTEEGAIKVFNAGYSTEVAKHTIQIKTNNGADTGVVEFFLTKKGVGWSTLHRTQDMNLSWYYNWGTVESTGSPQDLEFVPMIWGNWGDTWLADEDNKEYGTVLAFNEPDWSDQSNVPVSVESAKAWAERYEKEYGTAIAPPKSVEESWQSFMDSGLRIGSPVTALAPPYCNGTIQMNPVDGPDNWWFDFMDLMEEYKDEGWGYDFVAVHSYNAGCDAKGFLQMVDETWELTGKPIWITEFGVADWGNTNWDGGNAKTQQQVAEFITEVCNGLDERPYVERYAWFPFSPEDDFGGASGIFNYSSGELNKVGKVYAALGLPEGYENAVIYDELPPVIEDENEDENQDAELIATETARLKTAITEAEAFVKGDYTEESWSVFEKALTDAKKVSEDEAATLTQLQDAIKKLEEAKNGLVKINNTGSNKEETKKPQQNQGGQTTQKPQISVSVAKNSILMNETTQVTVAGGTNPTYVSSNPAVATVDANGTVTGVSAGTATITATASGATASVAVTVVKPTVKWNVNYKTVPLQLKNKKKVNKTTALQPTGLQAGDSVVSVISSKTKIATAKMSKKGKITITPKKVGKTKLTLTTKYGAKATITLKVQKGAVKVTKLTVDNVKKKKLNLKKGQKFTLETTKKYITALDKVTFSTSDKKIVTVTKKGVIKAKKKGKATITVKCQKKKVAIKVTVK